MKVNQYGPKAAGINTARTTDVASNAKAENKTGVKDNAEIAGSAKVNVSERASMMQKAKEIAAQDQVDEAKVARLQKLIDEGKYKVDAAAVADRLVNEHLLMSE